MSSIPEKPDLPVGQDDVLALDGCKLEPKVRHLCLHFPLLLPAFDLLTLDVEQDLEYQNEIIFC